MYSAMYSMIKNVINDEGRSSFDGTVIVNQGAQLTNSNQLINNLMLEHKVLFFRNQDITCDEQINLAKKFGPLEIKVLKCGKFTSGNKIDNVAYLQVKDLTENNSEKVFIFNGWTFSSDPTLAPFDHAIYDLQLVNCNKV